VLTLKSDLPQNVNPSFEKQKTQIPHAIA